MVIDIATVSIIVGFLVLYTKIIFDYSKIKTELQMNTTMLTKIELLLTSHDDKIEKNYNLAWTNALAVEELKTELIEYKKLNLAIRLNTLETQHKEHHKEILNEY